MSPAPDSPGPGTSGSGIVPTRDTAQAAVTAEKQRWRNRLLAVRASRSPADRAVAARALQAQMLTVVAESGWRTISAYVPFGDEPGSVDTIELLHAAGLRILLPRTGRDDLTWAAYEGDLRPGRLGIGEPTGEDLGVSALAEVEAVLAPALAVDRNGIRLGYGRGYYDRALSTVSPQLTVLAIVYDDELVDSLPSADYDRPVTHTITPLLGTRPIRPQARTLFGRGRLPAGPSRIATSSGNS